MALNPFFLQGSPGEQRLVQDLINEQLKIYGVDVIYIPRKFVRKQTIIREIQSSKFDDNYAIEAYINNYDGYSGQGDILSKFGVNLKDELSLVISKERFEDFISPFLEASDNDEIILASRPREGDLVYFPLGQRIFEVKFVEHEVNFYQLGKLYMYELKCELFEYEDEVIDTTIDEIDSQIKDEGYITTLQLIGAGSTASATATLATGYIREIFLNNDGYGYTSTPIVAIGTAPAGGINAAAVAITTSKGGVRSVESIILTCAGAGYTTIPNITISGGNGIGAAATCSIETIQSGISTFTMVNFGNGYIVPPPVTISSPIGSGITASAVAIVGFGQTISSLRITNPGVGYTVAPSVTIAPPPVLSGIGTYIFNEEVFGSVSGTRGRVKSWDFDTKILKVSLVDNAATKEFYPGELLVGAASSAIYSVQSYDSWDQYDKYSENVEIENAAEGIVDFSESNPFGTF
ncbi:virion structural protein [Synechococcus phage S-SRM01]|uniref:Neck protein n=1 Tax=Synechococcus phage S-SRM01 TaxID=2781608 RepID=A0A879R368_9CAUD|nr:virion structural protein [Synechococcus phage S-SRM01]QPX48167.1 neck protein [Synechococcus phage S-SRM01]